MWSRVTNYKIILSFQIFLRRARRGQNIDSLRRSKYVNKVRSKDSDDTFPLACKTERIRNKSDQQPEIQ